MSAIMPFIVIGIVTGSVYGLAATGLVLTYKTSGIFNFAHGAVATVAAYGFFALNVTHGVPWPIAFVLCVFVLGPVIGIVLELIARQLAQVRTRHGAQRRPGSRFAGAGALQDRSRVVEAVLLHAGQVGVPWPRARQLFVASQVFQLGGIDRVGRHDLFPLGPLGVLDVHGHRPTLGEPVPDPAQELDVVGLEAHPRASAEAEAPARQLLVDVGRGDRDSGHHAFQHSG